MEKQQKAEVLEMIESLRKDMTTFKVHVDLDYNSTLSPVRIGWLLGCIASASAELANSTLRIT